MKKYLILILLICVLALYATANAGMNCGILGSGSGEAAGCSTPTTGDELNEGFTGTGYENSWTESGSGTIDEDFTLSGTPPSGSCTEGLNIVSSESSDISYWDNGSTIAFTNDIDYVCEIYIDSKTLTNYTYSRIIAWSNVTTNVINSVQIVNVDGYTLRGAGSGNSTGVTFSDDTWLTVTMHLDATPASSYFQCSGCDDETQKTFTRTDTVSRYLVLGPDSLGAGESVDIEYGYCYVNIPD